MSAAAFSAANGPADRDTFVFTTNWTDSAVPTTGATYRTDDLSDMIEAFIAAKAGEVSTSDEIVFVIEDIGGIRKSLSFEGNGAPELVLVFQDEDLL